MSTAEAECFAQEPALLSPENDTVSPMPYLGGLFDRALCFEIHRCQRWAKGASRDDPPINTLFRPYLYVRRTRFEAIELIQRLFPNWTNRLKTPL